MQEVDCSVLSLLVVQCLDKVPTRQVEVYSVVNRTPQLLVGVIWVKTRRFGVICGQQSGQAQQGGGLFGQQNQQNTSGGGLFGNKPTGPTTTNGGGLFGNKPATGADCLVVNNNNPATTTTATISIRGAYLSQTWNNRFTGWWVICGQQQTSNVGGGLFEVVQHRQVGYLEPRQMPTQP